MELPDATAAVAMLHDMPHEQHQNTTSSGGAHQGGGAVEGGGAHAVGGADGGGPTFVVSGNGSHSDAVQGQPDSSGQEAGHGARVDVSITSEQGLVFAQPGSSKQVCAHRSQREISGRDRV